MQVLIIELLLLRVKSTLCIELKVKSTVDFNGLNVRIICLVLQ